VSWREELACQAGFYNGEGWCGVQHHQRQPRSPQLVLRVNQNDREVLYRFQSVVGVGDIYGPYRSRGRKNPISCYSVTGFHHVQAVAAMLWPWLSAIKRRQIIDAFARVRAHWNPAQCSQGHLLSGDNVMSQSVLGQERRFCRTCACQGQQRRWALSSANPV